MISFKNSITPQEINSLRKSIGFRQIDEEQIQNGINGSSLIVAAYDDSSIIGMARLIWDGGAVALIVDSIVNPMYKSIKFKEEIIERVLSHLKKQLKPGFGIQVDIRAWGDEKSDLMELGFKESLVKYRGTPMHICLTDNIEITDRKFRQCGHDD